MASISGKIVGARLPMDEYVKVVSTAAALKMSVSDYLISRLYATTQVNDDSFRSAVTEVNRLKAEVNDLNVKKEEAVKTALTLKKHAETRDQSQKDASFKIDELTRNTENLRNALAKSDEVAIQWKVEAEKLQKKLALSQQSLDNTILKLTNTEAKRLDAEKRQRSLRDALAEAHNNSLVGKMSDKYWDIIDRFIPPR